MWGCGEAHSCSFYDRTVISDGSPHSCIYVLCFLGLAGVHLLIRLSFVDSLKLKIVARSKREDSVCSESNATGCVCECFI